MAILLNGPLIPCVICGIDFKSANNRSKYCSKSCRQKGKYNSQKEAKQKWKNSHKEQIKISSQIYYRKRGKNKQLQSKYNLSELELHKILEQQKFKCKICGQSIKIIFTDPKERAVIDHDHLSNKIRGILCTRCNTGLGQFEDSIIRLINAADYISFYAKK